MSTVADYSFQHPDPADLVAAGHIGVMRYLCPRSSSPSQDYKRLQPAELDALHQAGLAVGVVWEIGTNDDAGGYQQGVAYGTEARSQARALGFPDSTPIYWAVDRRLRDLTGPLDYGRGFTSAAGFARPYGEGRLIDAVVAEGLADCGWMPETWGASDHLALIQLVGTPKVPGTDDNTVVRSDWGGWPTPPTQPPPEEDDMPGPLTEASAAGQFVTDLYVRIAKRAPADIDAGGYDYWLQLLLTGRPPASVEHDFAGAVYAAAAR